MAKKKEVIRDDRDEKGRFVAGKSGNPKGRPLGAKNRIVQLKQDLELLLREEVVRVDDIREVWNTMVQEAKLGNVTAGKYILDKVMSQATSAEDTHKEGGDFVIHVRNLTLNADTEETVEGEYEEVE